MAFATNILKVSLFNHKSICNLNTPTQNGRAYGVQLKVGLSFLHKEHKDIPTSDFEARVIGLREATTRSCAEDATERGLLFQRFWAVIEASQVKNFPIATIRNPMGVSGNAFHIIYDSLTFPCFIGVSWERVHCLWTRLLPY